MSASPVNLNSQTAPAGAPTLVRPSGEPSDSALFETAMAKVERLNTMLLASTLVAPLLKEARGSALRSDFLRGGFAEDAFRSRLDTRLADAVAAGMSDTLTDDLNERFGQWLMHQKPQRVQDIALMNVDLIG